jgi:hypothetical protein
MKKLKKTMKAGSVKNIAKLVEKINIPKEVKEEVPIEIPVEPVTFNRFLKITGTEKECAEQIQNLRKNYNVSIVGLVNITDIKTYALELEEKK